MRRLLALFVGFVVAPSVAPFAACTPTTPVDAGVVDEPWQRVFEGLPGALLSVWGTAHDDVYFVGEDPGDGRGPYALHWDGASFRRFDTGAAGTLWWVRGDSAGHVFMSGDDGLVLRYDVAADAFTTLPPAGTDDLFGVMPFSADDAWVVGVGSVLHWDGVAWSVPAGLTGDMVAGLQLYKIWGRATDDLWIVGAGDALVRFVDGAFTRVDLPVEGGLFTITGDDDLVLGVGGFIDGIVVESRGDEPLKDATAPGMPELSGVDLRGDVAVAVGLEGAVWNRGATGWTRDEDAPAVFTSHHAVFVDDEGGVWAVGGNLAGEPLVAGTLFKRGRRLEDATFP